MNSIATSSTRAPIAISTASSARSRATAAAGSRCGPRMPAASPWPGRSATGRTTCWVRATSGVWSGWVDGAGVGDRYVYRVTTPDGHDRREVRPGRRCHRGTTVDRLDDRRSRPRVGRRRVDGERGDRVALDAPDVDLRAAPRLVGSPRHRRQPVPALRRTRRPARRPRARPRLHPRRAAPDHGAPVLRVVGLPDHRVLRPDRPLRHARRPDER